MFRSPIFLATGALGLLAPLAAHADSVNQTLDGKRLDIEVTCVDRVEIQPQAGLAGKVTVEAHSDRDGELKDFVFAGGETASVSRKRQVCTSDGPKVTVSVRVPAGMPLDIKSGGSTDYTIGAVGGPLDAHLAGAGNLKAEAVSDLYLTIAGFSNARLSQVTGATDIRIAGSGDVKIGSATMPSLKIDVRGSGNVQVDQGQIGTLDAGVTGSGNLNIKAVVKDANLSSVGSGDIQVAKVTGSLQTNKAGSGSIRAGRD
ncbi:MAG TPA: DUF2807 domain-containing protein [Aliidongia sp.]|nr:DUF2807 domain-containing protein [Aliidongia sp.]